MSELQYNSSYNRGFQQFLTTFRQETYNKKTTNGGEITYILTAT